MVGSGDTPLTYAWTRRSVEYEGTPGGDPDPDWAATTRVVTVGPGLTVADDGDYHCVPVGSLSVALRLLIL